MPSDRSTRRRFLALAGSTLIGATAGCSRSGKPIGFDENAAGADPTATPSSTGTAGSGGSAGDSPFADVYRETIGSIVYIQASSFRGTGTGSGFVSGGGHVVTNHHVVAGADEVTVRFNDGGWQDVTVRGTDPYSDLAVLGVETPDYATPLASVDADPPIGTEVAAIGHPFGLDRSMTTGIVSGVDRNIPAPVGRFDIADGIQTDAAVNPGNSGGPLVTADGEVVGVVSSGGGENIAFAVSAALLRRVVPSLAETGEYAHPYMGVGLGTVTPRVAEANDLEESRGVIVTRVVEGGPADGVLRGSPDSEYDRGARLPVGGDVIRRLEDTPVEVLNDLSEFLALRTSPGDEIDVTVLRDGAETTVSLELGERPPPEALAR